VYVDGNWYVFFGKSGLNLSYKKSSDGSTWSSSVDLDSSDTDNRYPSVWVEGNTIYVVWVDNSSDTVEVNTINTASSDALGTQCTSADVGDDEVTTIAVADDGTVYVATEGTSAVLKLTFSGCTFTDITSGSGVGTLDEPTITTIGNNLHVVFDDTNLYS